MIKINIEIESGIVLAIIDLPEEPPSQEDCIKAIACTQFDPKSQAVLVEKIKVLYGEEFYSTIDSTMTDMLESIKDLITISINSNPEIPAGPTVMFAHKATK